MRSSLNLMFGLGFIAFVLLQPSGCARLLRDSDRTDGPHLFVVNALNQAVSVISPNSGSLIKRIELKSQSPHDITYLSKLGKVYVVNTGFQQLSVIDARSQTLVKNILTLPRTGHKNIPEDRPCMSCHIDPVGGMPVNLTTSPDQSRLFVTNTHAKTISVIDTKIDKVVDLIETDDNVLGIALSGTELWVSNRKRGTVSVIDVATKRPAIVLKVGALPGFVRARTAADEVYVCISGDSKVLVFDAKSKRIKYEIKTRLGTRALAFNESQGIGYAANYYSDSVTTFELATGKVIGNAKFKLNPDDLVLSEDNSELYISCTGTNEIVVADAVTLQVKRRISAGQNPSDMVLVP